MKLKLYKLLISFSALLTIFVMASVAYAGGNLVELDSQVAGSIYEQKWDDRMLPIKWVLSSDGDPGSGISNQTIVDEFTAAFDTWQSIQTSRIAFTYGGEEPRRLSGIDGHNIVTFTDPNVIFAPGVVGLTANFSFTTQTVVDSTNDDLDGDGLADIPDGTYPAGAIFDSDIMFNSSLPYSTTGANNTTDMRAIALHEVGHFIGLSHSSITDAVMYPFLSGDISSARILKNDDIAYASYFYPNDPDYSSTFGTITGHITNGASGIPIVGAHVYAADVNTGVKIVGSYSSLDGSYTIPIAAGSYFVGIEPLDGEPIALDPKRINDVISSTLDTNFPEEFYDANESSVEADPNAAIPVTVTANAATPGIDIITNTIDVPGIGLLLSPGINYFAYPVSAPPSLKSFDLIAALGDDTEINSIEAYNPDTGLFERTNYLNGVPSGDNFSIERGKGYIVYSNVQKAVNFTGTPDCPDISVNVGLNLISVPCPPATYSAFDLLKNLGNDYEVADVQRYDQNTGTFEKAVYSGGIPTGVDFPVVNGEAYVADMAVNKTNIKVPGQGQIFPPSISGISPGRGVPGSIVEILGKGFDTDLSNDLVKFNNIIAPVLFATPTLLTVKVPVTATTGPVTVTVNDKESNSLNYIVVNKTITENPNGDTNVVSGQTAQGEISAEGEQDRYTFIALAGSKVTISAESLTAGTPDLMLMLEGPSGALLLVDDDSGIGKNPLINNYKIPETGEYTVVVTSVPGSGTGPYNLTLNISNISTAPKISVLSGGSQSSLPGTALPYPLEVLVTSSSGQPLSGVPITFTATNVTLAQTTSSSLVNAGTTSVVANENGIATVQATLPATPDATFNIVVTAQGFTAQTMVVGSMDSQVDSYVITGNNQDCGGTGCPVNQDLPNDYSIQFLDNTGSPINHALTQWKVVSGNGSLSQFNPTEEPGADPGIQTTGADGTAKVRHKLGTKVYFDGTTIHIPQTVAVTVPGQSKPVLFSSTAKAAEPSTITQERTNFSRLTFGTGVLNAIDVIVNDQYGNPVKGAVVTPTANGGIIVGPGLYNGTFFPDYQTDEEGRWVGKVLALDVKPTIDEFGGRSSGVAPTYQISLSVPGVSPVSYNVDVDMGPVLVTASGQGVSKLISHDLDNPVVKQLLRFERFDTYIPDGNGDDDDFGDWRDESFDPANIGYYHIQGVPIKITPKRADGETDPTPTTVNGTNGTTISTDVNGEASVNVKLGAVGGNVLVEGQVVGGVTVTFHNDSYSQGQDGLPLHDPVQSPNPQTFTGENNFAEDASINAIPVIVTVTIDDKGPVLSGDQVSGIDLSTLGMTLDGASSKTLFDGVNNLSFSLGKFPYYRRIFLNGIEQTTWPDANVLNSGMSELKLIYQPLGTDLNPGTNTNKVTVSKELKDKAGNATSTDGNDTTYDLNLTF